MKTNWTPSLTTKEALAICGPLSKPGKMPGHGYALPAQRCRLGSFLQHLPKAVCHYCYALRGRYLFPRVRAAMEKRASSLSDPRWVEAVSTLIYRSGNRYFRWHDSGDLQDIEHLRKIIQVCNKLKHVRFWLPTREYQTVEAYRRDGGEIPLNLCVRYSVHLVDSVPPLQYGLPVSTIYSAKRDIFSGSHVCPAPKQKNKCGTCRACWSPSVRIVTYELKGASRESTVVVQTD